MANKESILEFIEDYNIFRRILIWGSILLLAGTAFFGPYKLTGVVGATMGPKLGSGEYYGAVIPERICLGDFLRINDRPKSKVIVRSLIAFSGSKFKVTDGGYSIDGNTVKMSDLWVANAREQLAPSLEITIPEEQILVMRTAPDEADKNNYEAYLLPNIRDVDRLLERVIISFNPMRIGLWLRSNSKKCVPVS